MKILLIDDHALFREGLSLILKQLEEDTTVLEAENSAQAESITNDTDLDLDLVLLDLHLPDTQGFELLKHLRSKLPATPVAMLSADENAQQISKALNLGATGFITKSSNSQVMLSAVQLILSGGVYVPPAILTQQPTTLVPPPSPAAFSSGAPGSPVAPLSLGTDAGAGLRAPPPPPPPVGAHVCVPSGLITRIA